MNDLNNKDWNFNEKDFKSSEEYRHQCEVRWLLRFRNEQGLQRFREYLRSPGFGARLTRILHDVSEQWKKGNRGRLGDWR